MVAHVTPRRGSILHASEEYKVILVGPAATLTLLHPVPDSSPHPIVPFRWSKRPESRHDPLEVSRLLTGYFILAHHSALWELS